MAETNWIPSQRSGRAYMFGSALGHGVSQGLESILQNVAQQKAEKIRAGHLRTLNPGISEAEASALSGLGSNVYEPALRGGFGNNLHQEQSQQLQGVNGPNAISSSGHEDIKPMDFLKALAPLGLQMTPEQEKQLNSLPEEQQSRIADQVFKSLGPQQKDQLQNHWLAQQQLPEQNMPQQGQPKAQQVVGSQQPGIGPQQQPNRVSFGESLRNGQGKSLTQELAREKFESVQEEKEQKRIKAENSPFIKQMEKEVPIAEKTLHLVNEMLELESKGETPENLASRTAGAYLPGVLNPYAEYNAKSNEIAALKSQATGRPSVFMTQLQQSTKPNSSMPKEKRLNLLNSLKENAEVILGLEEASRDIVEQNGGKQIPNLKKHAEEKFFNGILPNPNEYEVNTEVEIYGEKFKNSPKGWVKVGKGK